MSVTCERDIPVRWTGGESHGVADCGDWMVVAPRGWPHAADVFAPVRLVRVEVRS
jgi:hypothetical protein